MATPPGHIPQLGEILPWLLEQRDETTAQAEAAFRESQDLRLAESAREEAREEFEQLMAVARTFVAVIDEVQRRLDGALCALPQRPSSDQ